MSKKEERKMKRKECRERKEEYGEERKKINRAWKRNETIVSQIECLKSG